MRFLIVTLTSLTLLACTGTQPHPPIKRQASPDYDPVLRQYTRSGRDYKGVERILIVTATLQTPEFLDARFLEDARVHARPREWVATAVDEYTAKNPQLTMVLFFDATLPGWEDLDHRDSIWRVALETGGTKHDPVSVEKLREENENMRHLFPFTNPYGTLFILTYPVSPDAVAGGDAKLTIDGPPAHIVLDFAPED